MSGIQHTETINSNVGQWKVYKDTTPDDAPNTFKFKNIISTTRQLTELVAYKFWEEAGRPDGRADEFWFEAEKFLDAHGYDLKSHGLMSKGYFFAPYVPSGNQYHIDLEKREITIESEEEARAKMGIVALDPDIFVPRKGLLTRYGRKILRDGAKYYERKSVGDNVLPEDEKKA